MKPNFIAVTTRRPSGKPMSDFIALSKTKGKYNGIKSINHTTNIINESLSMKAPNSFVIERVYDKARISFKRDVGSDLIFCQANSPVRNCDFRHLRYSIGSMRS